VAKFWKRDNFKNAVQCDQRILTTKKIPMKTILVSFVALVAAGGAFAGERVVATDRTARYSEGKCDRTRKTRNAGTPGAYYHSNFFHNAIMLINTCVSIRDLAGGKTGSKRGHGGMPGSFDKEPAP
jgi:hypothetical protein